MTFMLIGLLFTAAYIILPHFCCWLARPEGSTWAPINSGFKYGSDDNIYASLVYAVRLNHWKLRWPVEGCIGVEPFEIVRIASYRLTTLLGCGFSDSRWFHFTAYLFGILSNYGCLWLAMRTLELSDQASTAASLACIFWTRLIERFPKAIKQTVARHAWNPEGKLYFDLINDNFRYVILSSTGLWTGLTLALTELAARSHDSLYFFALGLLAIILLFVYPGTALSLGLYIVARIMTGIAIDGASSEMWLLGIGPSLVLIWLFLRGTSPITLMRTVCTPPPMMAEMHMSKKEAETKLRKKITSALRHSPILTALIGWWLTQSDVMLEPMSLSTLAVAICLFIGQFHDGLRPILIKLYKRGGLVLQAAVFFAIICAMLPDCPSSFGSLALWVFLSLPVFGLLRMCRTHAKNQTYSMATNRWKALQWLDKHVPSDATVCCLDIADMQLQTVYSLGRAYVGGAEWLQSPALAFSRYFEVLTLCGISHQMVHNWVRDFSVNRTKHHRYPTTPRSEEVVVEGVLFLNRMLYQPYLKTCDGIAINDESGRWSLAFLDHLLDLSTEASVIEKPSQKPDFILISERLQQRRCRQDSCPDGYHEAVKIDGVVIYKHQGVL